MSSFVPRRACGAPRSLVPGDIGLVRLKGLGTFGAIWTGRRWAVKAKDGIIIADFPTVAAWRFEGWRRDWLSSDSDILPAFLATAAGHPFAFGGWDCALTVANWVELVTCTDPAAELRGRYATRIGWLRIVNRHGGLAPLFQRLARRAGLTRIR